MATCNKLLNEGNLFNLITPKQRFFLRFDMKKQPFVQIRVSYRNSLLKKLWMPFYREKYRTYPFLLHPLTCESRLCTLLQIHFINLSKHIETILCNFRLFTNQAWLNSIEKKLDTLLFINTKQRLNNEIHFLDYIYKHQLDRLIRVFYSFY